jgi:hypothetical protein
MSQQRVLDYANSGLTIRRAMLDHVRRFPNKAERPDFILWNGLYVKTSDSFAVPETGIVEATFLSSKEGVEQGFDLEVGGWFRLENGEQVPLLRTWKDDRFEDGVEYPFLSGGGKLWVWNVYKMRYPGGKVVEEKWTENAGFWVERKSDSERTYHCSHGMANPPDFESLVFAVKVRERKSDE